MKLIQKIETYSCLDDAFVSYINEPNRLYIGIHLFKWFFIIEKLGRTWRRRMIVR